jgi:hypothetical protein
MGRSVQIGVGYNAVVLPNGNSYDAGQSVTLTDAQWEQVDPSLVGTVIVDLGHVADESVTQQAAIANLTVAAMNLGAPVSLGSPTDLQELIASVSTLTDDYNAIKVELAKMNDVVAELAKVNALLAELRTAGIIAP